MSTPPVLDLLRDGREGFQMPPAELLPSLTQSIQNATAGLALGEVAVVGALTETGVKGAFVAKTEQGLEVMLWMGKDWAAPGMSYGFGIMKRWTRV